MESVVGSTTATKPKRPTRVGPFLLRCRLPAASCLEFLQPQLAALGVERYAIVAQEVVADDAAKLETEEYARRAEASCELGRARVLQGGRAEDRQRLRECLPIYRAWGLADREVVAAIESLVSRPVQFSE